ncbi:MAG TPA: AI-2E family transporter [Bryobacteraceae bacterium]|nr:AI-2E family transporter [Bryobacteraceae bacterium]
MVAPVSSAQKTVFTGFRILALGAAIAMLYYGRIFFITVIIASMIAFLLDPIVEFFMKMRLPRGFASFAVCSISLMFLYLAGLGLYTQSLAMMDDLPAYGERINEIVDNASGRIERFEEKTYQTLIPKRFQDRNPPPPEAPAPASARGKRNKAAPPPQQQAQQPPAIQEVRVRPEPTNFVTYLTTYLSSFYNVLLMASFVPFLVYFLLSWRDHLRSRFLYLFDGDARYAAEHAWAGVGDMVRAYVIGNFLLGLVLGLASSILFAAVKLPYWLVVGPLSGFLSLIPYVGLPLAMIPPMIAALPKSNEPAVYLFLAVSVSMLHLFALNLLYPKFVGARVHLNPLVVTIGLMFWGMLWGGIGLLLAIPLTAGIKAVFDNVSSLQPYGRLMGD